MESTSCPVYGGRRALRLVDGQVSVIIADNFEHICDLNGNLGSLIRKIEGRKRREVP